MVDQLPQVQKLLDFKQTPFLSSWLEDILVPLLSLSFKHTHSPGIMDLVIS
jgi:hypothetical protein